MDEQAEARKVVAQASSQSGSDARVVVEHVVASMRDQASTTGRMIWHHSDPSMMQVPLIETTAGVHRLVARFTFPERERTGFRRAMRSRAVRSSLRLLARWYKRSASATNEIAALAQLRLASSSYVEDLLVELYVSSHLEDGAQ